MLQEIESMGNPNGRNTSGRAPRAGVSRFDFVGKLARRPEYVVNATQDEPSRSLATAFLDLGSGGCNHDCVFCDGHLYPVPRDRFPTARLLTLAAEIADLGADSVILVGENAEPTTHPGFVATARALLARNLRLGLYTNGSVIDDEVFAVLEAFDFVRVSLDAGAAETHHRLHRPRNGADFGRACDFLAHVASGGARETGASFLVLGENVGEIRLAAERVRSLQADYLELKPAYTEAYGFDADAFGELRGELERQLRLCASLESDRFRVLLNPQLADVLAGRVEAHGMTRVPSARPCLACRLRIVVGPRGCYPCPPFRGDDEHCYGDVRVAPLASVWFGRRRREVNTRRCNRRCPYHAQNAALLAWRESGRPPVFEEGEGHGQEGFI